MVNIWFHLKPPRFGWLYPFLHIYQHPIPHPLEGTVPYPHLLWQLPGSVGIHRWTLGYTLLFEFQLLIALTLCHVITHCSSFLVLYLRFSFYPSLFYIIASCLVCLSTYSGPILSICQLHSTIPFAVAVAAIFYSKFKRNSYRIIEHLMRWRTLWLLSDVLCPDGGILF